MEAIEQGNHESLPLLRLLVEPDAAPLATTVQNQPYGGNCTMIWPFGAFGLLAVNRE
jgi:hypothetical protein